MVMPLHWQPDVDYADLRLMRLPRSNYWSASLFPPTFTPISIIATSDSGSLFRWRERLWHKSATLLPICAEHLKAREVLRLKAHHLTSVGEGLAVGNFEVATLPAVWLTRHRLSLDLDGAKHPLHAQLGLPSHRSAL